MPGRNSGDSSRRRTLPQSKVAEKMPSKAEAAAAGLIEGLLRVIADIAAVGDEVKSCKRNCWNLARRVKLLVPLFEETHDVKGPLPPAAQKSLQSFRPALLHTRKILMECCTRSRLLMVLHRELMASRFRSLNLELSDALEQLPMDVLAISEEIQEQANMVLGQLKRANPLEDANEEQLHTDLMFLLSTVPLCDDSLDLSGSFQEGPGNSSPVNVAVWGPFMNKLGLTSLPAVKREMEALKLEKAKLQEQDSKAEAQRKGPPALLRAKSRDHGEAEGKKEGKQEVGLTSLTRSSSGIPLSKPPLTSSGSNAPPDHLSPNLQNDKTSAEAKGSHDCRAMGSSMDSSCCSLDNIDKAIILMKQLRESLAGGTIDRSEDDDSSNSQRSAASLTQSDTGSEEECAAVKAKEDEPVCVVYSRTGQSLHPPEDFLCPISLEVMRDPVIVSTGQTYDRQFIEHWIKEGHKTCPRTQQLLSQPLMVIPNYSLRSLIQQWCEANNVDLPTRSPKLSSSSTGPGNNSPPEASQDGTGAADTGEADVDVQAASLTFQLNDMCVEMRKKAAAELRLLTKRSDGNRIAVAGAGAIPHLIRLLDDSDEEVQEHAVTTLLNLSINDDNKQIIASEHAIPAIIQVLQAGSMESRENSAAALFSLSAVDHNKVTIGQAGAIPALVQLLREGGKRGKKDAATALFNICVHPANKSRAVRAGLVPALVRLLQDTVVGMVDESLAILSILSSAPEGQDAMGKECLVPILVEITGVGTPRNKENASAVLLTLCSNSAPYTDQALASGAQEKMQVLLRTGTSRAKRKASALLQHFREHEMNQIAVELGGVYELDGNL